MAKPTVDDVCTMLAEHKPFKFYNGFFYNSKYELVSRQKMRDIIALKVGRYQPNNLDRFEETICEHNKCEDKNPREVFINSIPAIEGESYILNWLKKQYPQIDWEQVIYDIVMHKSEKIYVFHGIAEAGKSQLIDILKNLFQNYSVSLTVKQLSNRFNLGEVIGKLFVGGDDLGRESFGDMVGLIKSMATGGKISMERKFIRPIQCRNEANFVFCTNNPLILDITDEGVLRRFVIFYFDKKMELPCDYDEFREKYINNAEEIGKLIYQLKKVKFNKQAIKDLEVMTIKKLLAESPVSKCGERDYEDYAKYCKEHGFKAFNKDNFDKVWSLIDKYLPFNDKALEVFSFT
ncbi:MAG: DUF5906 domain-containing protein [Firmicutes bacterium]|nr:DUF5906 domain-containing protein [Bacillota bacterium]